MSLFCGPFGGPDGSVFDPIKRAGILLNEPLSSWLTGACAPAPNSGHHGAGLSATDPAASGGLLGFERSARQSRARVEPRGFASIIQRPDIRRFAGRRGRMVSIGTTRSGWFASPWRLATADRWCAWRLCRATQLGSIASALQSTRRAQRCNTRIDTPGSAHHERADLRASLCKHALRQCFLYACLARRAASTIRHICLRAFL